MLQLQRNEQGLRKCRIDEWASVCDAPTATPGRLALEAYVRRGMNDLGDAVEYATTIGDHFKDLGAPEQVFVVAGPTSTTRCPYEVVSDTAGYSVLHDTRPLWGKTLKRMLASMTRQTAAMGVQPDPVAQEILASRCIAGLERELRRIDLGPLENARPYGAGASSVALALGGRVIRIGLGELPDRPVIPEVLQAEVRGRLGDLRFEVLPKADTAAVTPDHLQALLTDLSARGFEWGDAALDNIGLVDGRPVIFDSHGVRPCPTEIESAESSHGRERDRGETP